jgi:hypothetical protein
MLGRLQGNRLARQVEIMEAEQKFFDRLDVLIRAKALQNFAEYQITDGNPVTLGLVA